MAIWLNEGSSRLGDCIINIFAGAALASFCILANADSITYQYDALGRVNQTIDSNGNIGNYSYDATGNLLSVKAVANNVLQIFSFTPTTAAPGDSMVIEGSGFNATPTQNVVTFVGGVQGTVTQGTTTQLTVTIPVITGIGYFSVNNGSATVNSPAPFVPLSMLGAPTISSFTPQMGTGGTSVVISGTNFDTTQTNDNVSIGGITAPIAAATATQLTVTAPAGASGKVVVVTRNGFATSTQDYISLPSGVSASNVAFTGRVTVNGGNLTVTTPPSGKQAALLFSGTGGQQLTWVTGASSYASAVSFNVYGPNGASIFSGSLGANGMARFTHPLPSTGNYVVVLTPNSTDSGSISLGLIADKTGALQLGKGTAITLGAAQGGEYTFTAAANTGYGLGVPDLNLGTGANYTVYLDSATTSGLTSCVLNGATAACYFDPRYFTAAGTYTLRFVPNGATVAGNFTADLSADAGTTLTVGAATSTTTTTIPGQLVRDTFTASAGQNATVVITGDTLVNGYGTSYVYVYNPSDTNHTGSPAHAITGGSGTVVLSNLPESGTYQVVVASGGYAPAASVSVQVLGDASGTLSLGSGTPISLSAGQAGRYTFTAAANTGYGLGVPDLNLGTGAYYTVYLDSATKSGLTSCSLRGATAACYFDPMYFTAAGTYTLRFVPNGATVAGNFTADLSADAGTTLTVGAATSTTTTTIPGQLVRDTFTASAGQNATVVITGNTLLSSSGSGYVYVYKPSDTNHTSPVASQYLSTSSSTVVLSNLPESGTYQVLVEPNGYAPAASVSVQVN